MFTFSIVKKIGEGDYLKDDSFIIERVRKERALNMNNLRIERNKLRLKNRVFGKDERNNPS